MKHMILGICLLLSTTGWTTERTDARISGPVSSIFLGNTNSSSVGEICILYVKTYDRTVGIATDYRSCTANLPALRSLQNVRISVPLQALTPITNRVVLSVLNRSLPAPYFQIRNLQSLLAASRVERPSGSSGTGTTPHSDSDNAGGSCETYEEGCSRDGASDPIDGTDEGSSGGGSSYDDSSGSVL